MPAFTVPAHSAIQWDEKLRKSYMDIVGKGGQSWAALANSPPSLADSFHSQEAVGASGKEPAPQ